jgi:hypothetical protein
MIYGRRGGLTEGLADDGGGERGHRALRKRVLQSSAMSRVGFGGPPSPVFAPTAAVVLSEARWQVDGAQSGSVYHGDGEAKCLGSKLEEHEERVPRGSNLY